MTTQTSAALEKQALLWSPETPSKLEELLNSKRLFRKNPDHYSVAIEPPSHGDEANYLKIALERDNGTIEYRLRKSEAGSGNLHNEFWAYVGCFGEGLYSNKTTLFDLFHQFERQARESGKYDYNRIAFLHQVATQTEEDHLGGGFPPGLYGGFYVAPQKTSSNEDEATAVSGFVKDLSAHMKVLDRGITLDEAKHTFVRDLNKNLARLWGSTTILASTCASGVYELTSFLSNHESLGVELSVLYGTIAAGVSLLTLLPLSLYGIVNKGREFTENPSSYTFQEHGRILLPGEYPFKVHKIKFP